MDKTVHKTVTHSCASLSKLVLYAILQPSLITSLKDILAMSDDVDLFVCLFFTYAWFVNSYKQDNNLQPQ